MSKAAQLAQDVNGQKCLRKRESQQLLVAQDEASKLRQQLQEAMQRTAELEGKLLLAVQGKQVRAGLQ